jgi:hypothetical protein
VLCFVLCNDIYGATTTERRGRRLTAAKRERVVNYSELLAQNKLKEAMLGASKQEYIADPKRGGEANMLEVLNGSNLCSPATAFFPSPLIVNIPYTDPNATTIGRGEDYNIETGLILKTQGACPEPKCFAVNDKEGFADRGFAYEGTGIGEDAAYRINFGQTANMKVLLHPHGNTITDDLALIVYGARCSNSHSDVVVMADNRYPDPSNDPNGNDEEVTITQMPAGYYNIVVDAYSFANQQPASGGNYDLYVTCADGSGNCPQPLPVRERR